MLPEERKRTLLQVLQRRGAADVGSLSESLGVSPATVRRDLHALETQGQLRRTHGGAVLPHVSTAFEPLHQEKMGRRADRKAAIARLAKDLVRPGEVVMLDSGSTTLALARELTTVPDLTVITSDLQIALELGDAPSVHVIIVGGTVRRSLYSVIGPYAERMLADLNANVSFLGADAVSFEAGMTNATVEEVPIKRAMMRAGRRSVLLVDSSKFGHASLARIADLTEFDEIVTDDALEPDTLRRCRDADLPVRIASA